VYFPKYKEAAIEGRSLRLVDITRISVFFIDVGIVKSLFVSKEKRCNRSIRGSVTARGRVGRLPLDDAFQDYRFHAMSGFIER
jgi:hypothetical protein